MYLQALREDALMRDLRPDGLNHISGAGRQQNINKNTNRNLTSAILTGVPLKPY
jgi:hypothetical protein